MELFSWIWNGVAMLATS